MKNEANRLGITPNVAYTTFFSRLLMERLSLINNGILLVKGSFGQFIHLGELSRPILDVDLSSLQEYQLPINLLFSSMHDIKSEHITFNISSSLYQTKNGVYKIPVLVKIAFDKNDVPIIVSIPVDFKDNNKVIFETQFKPVQPIFENDKLFYVNTPSFEEHLAEKLYIISNNTRTDIMNTRVKDFYDIYMLHGKEYDFNKFSIYFQAMVMLYGNRLQDIDAKFLNNEFIIRHKELWDRMREKYQFMDKELSFDEAVFYAKAVLKEQIQKIRRGDIYQAKLLVDKVRSRKK